MEPSLLSLPRELRDMISKNVLVADQTFHLKSNSYSGLAAYTTTPAIALTCKQLHSESNQVLRRAAFAPDTKICATVYNFDFAALLAFIRTLRAHEIAAANRNRTILVSLLLCDVSNPAAQRRLHDWAAVCEALGLEVEYRVSQWASVPVKDLKALERDVGEMREGRKVLQALAASNVRSWSWKGWQGDVSRHG